jgi:hypothetical protein
MVILGIILILLGWLTGISILYVIGVILAVVGLALWFIPMGGRTHRYY